MASDASDHQPIGLLEGIASTRAIRRFRDEPIPEEDLATIFFSATRAPTGSNMQPYRFLVLRDGPVGTRARTLLGNAFRDHWSVQRLMYGYEDAPLGSRARRMGETMQHFVDHIEDVPVIVLVGSELEEGHVWLPTDGGSVYPAIENLLLAARALGYGGVLSNWHLDVESELRALLEVPDTVFLFSTVLLGKPVGHHGSVRRLPLGDVVFEDVWRGPAGWAVDPQGTRFSGWRPPS